MQKQYEYRKLLEQRLIVNTKFLPVKKWEIKKIGVASYLLTQSFY